MGKQASEVKKRCFQTTSEAISRSVASKPLTGQMGRHTTGRKVTHPPNSVTGTSAALPEPASDGTRKTGVRKAQWYRTVT